MKCSDLPDADFAILWEGISKQATQVSACKDESEFSHCSIYC